MSQENVELVRLGFEAYQQGNWELVQENSHPDLLIVQPPEVPDAKTYRGPHAFADAAADWPSQWEDFQMELVELIDVDDERVISVTRHHGRGARAGSRWSSLSPTSTRCATASSSAWTCSSAAPRPSKP